MEQERRPSGDVRKHQINCHWNGFYNICPQLPCISYVLGTYRSIWAHCSLTCFFSSTSMLARKIALSPINTEPATKTQIGWWWSGMLSFTSHLPSLCVVLLWRHQVWMSLWHKSTWSSKHVSILSSRFMLLACGKSKPEPWLPGHSSNLCSHPFFSQCPGISNLLPGVGVFLKKSVPIWHATVSTSYMENRKMSCFVPLDIPCRQLSPNVTLHQCRVSDMH